MVRHPDGVKAVVLCGDKILLILRDDKPDIPYPNCWQIIGGGIENAELPKEAVKRELLEEACFLPNNCTFIGTHQSELRNTVYAYVFFVDSNEASKFKLGNEGQKIGFFTIDEALKLNLSDGSRKSLVRYRNKLESVMKTRQLDGFVL